MSKNVKAHSIILGVFSNGIQLSGGLPIEKYAKYWFKAGMNRSTAHEKVHSSLDELAKQISLEIATRLPGENILLLGVPCLNERDSLSRWITRVPKRVEGYSLVPILVDDGSTDGTAHVAIQEHWWVYRKELNKGLADSIHCLFEVARRVRPLGLITMDGDGQHDPSELSALCRAFHQADQALVTGSRYLGSTVGQSALRTKGLQLISWILWALIGKRILDPACGFRIYSWNALLKMKITHSRHYSAETLIRATLGGVPVVEVPITIAKRFAGESKQGMTLVYGIRFVRVMLESWFRARAENR